MHELNGLEGYSQLVLKQAALWAAVIGGVLGSVLVTVALNMLNRKPTVKPLLTCEQRSALRIHLAQVNGRYVRRAHPDNRTRP